MDSPSEIFCMKRKRLIVQSFFRQEYIKRHIFLNKIINESHRDVIESIKDKEGNITDYCNDKFNLVIEHINSCSSFRNENSEFIDLYSTIVKKFNMRLEVAISPFDFFAITERIGKDANAYFFDHPEPIFTSGQDFFEDLLYKVLFHLEHGLKTSLSDEEFYLKIIDRINESEEILNDKYDVEEAIALRYETVILIRMLFKKTIPESGLAVLNKMIDRYLVDEFDEIRIESRIHGILYWDWLSCMKHRGSNKEAPQFIKFLAANNLCGIKKERIERSDDNDLKRFREAFRIASLCIKEGKLLRTDSKGKSCDPGYIDWSIIKEPHYRMLEKYHSESGN